MGIKAALLDAPASSSKGAFVRIEELESESMLTDRHVPTITACDLEPGRYIWVPDAANPYGGEFVDRDVLDTMNAPDFDVAFNDLCESLVADGRTLPPATVAWLEYAKKRRKKLKFRRKKGAPR